MLHKALGSENRSLDFSFFSKFQVPNRAKSNSNNYDLVDCSSKFKVLINMSRDGPTLDIT